MPFVLFAQRLLALRKFQKKVNKLNNELTPTVQKFVLHWGEMGTRWGISRTVAQVHALLFLSPTPLCADDIVEQLKVARSNVSNALRELQMMGLVQREDKIGDRRDHFVAISDIWELFTVIAKQRKSREIDPTLDMLQQCVEEMEADDDTRGVTKRRIAQMQEFLVAFSTWYEEMAKLPKPVLRKLLQMGVGITNKLPLGNTKS